MKIISCGLPLPIQRLYIKRLKHMIWRWEHENFCGHCPITKNFRICEKNDIDLETPSIKAFEEYHNWWDICDFCQDNVGTLPRCPCEELKPQEALKRAKDFIERFEAEDGGKRCQIITAQTVMPLKMKDGISLVVILSLEVDKQSLIVDIAISVAFNIINIASIH